MATAFDPLHKWLGIPPTEQPPNHYRLLGITLLEADADAIANAADQRMALLRTFQIGERAADSQRLLNSVVAAKRVLLDREQKARYDVQLRRDTHPPAPPAAKPLPSKRPLIQTAPLISRPVVTPVTNALPDFTADRQSPAGSSRRRRDRNKSGSPVGLIAVVAAGVTAIAIGAWALNSNRATAPEQLAAKPLPVDHSLPNPLPEPDSHSSTPSASKAEERAVSPQPVSEERGTNDDVPVEPADSAELTSPSLLPMPESKPELPVPDSVPVRPPRTFVLPATPKKPAAPAAKDRKDGLRRVHELLKREFASAVSPDQKRDLATQLLHIARDNSDDPVLRFAMLDQAKELGIQAGKAAPIVTACNQIAAQYDLDVAELKQDALSRAIKGNRTPGDHRELALAMRTAAEEAVVSDHFDLAKRLATSSHASARKAKALELAKEVAVYIRQVDAVAREAEKVQPAREAVAADPDDQAANLAVGQFQCYFQGDWSRGLAHLERGGDVPAAQIARREREGPPASPSAIAVADDWWDLSVSEPAIAQHHIQLHAGEIYAASLGNAGAGLGRAKIEQRIAEVAAFSDAPLRFKLATGWWRIGQEATGKFIGVSEGSHNAGHPLIVWDRSGAEQQWRFEFDAQGWARMINRNSGLALGIREGSDRPGADAIQWHPSGYECGLQHVAGETTRIVFRHGGLCADAIDGRLIQSWPGETETQFWRLERAE